MKSTVSVFLTIVLFSPLFSFGLSASENPEKQPSNPNEDVSEILGEWMCISYVENTHDFIPMQEMPPETLFLKGIIFEDNGVAAWIFDEHYSRMAQWDSEKISSTLAQPALYSLKQINDHAYLFVEWISNDVTILSRKPGYYVFKKSLATNDTAALNPDVIGKWIVVDFVKQIEQFDPKQRSLNALPPLRKLYFRANETVWWIYKNNFKRKKKWSGNAVDYEPSYPAHFTIQKVNDKNYLFMEWISGDVIIRGQKPAYYVLKKSGQ